MSSHSLPRKELNIHPLPRPNLPRAVPLSATSGQRHEHQPRTLQASPTPHTTQSSSSSGFSLTLTTSSLPQSVTTPPSLINPLLPLNNQGPSTSRSNDTFITPSNSTIPPTLQHIPRGTVSDITLPLHCLSVPATTAATSAVVVPDNSDDHFLDNTRPLSPPSPSVADTDLSLDTTTPSLHDTVSLNSLQSSLFDDGAFDAEYTALNTLLLNVQKDVASLENKATSTTTPLTTPVTAVPKSNTVDMINKYIASSSSSSSHSSVAPSSTNSTGVSSVVTLPRDVLQILYQRVMHLESELAQAQGKSKKWQGRALQARTLLQQQRDEKRDDTATNTGIETLPSSSSLSSSSHHELTARLEHAETMMQQATRENITMSIQLQDTQSALDTQTRKADTAINEKILALQQISTVEKQLDQLNNEIAILQHDLKNAKQTSIDTSTKLINERDIYIHKYDDIKIQYDDISKQLSLLNIQYNDINTKYNESLDIIKTLHHTITNNTNEYTTTIENINNKYISTSKQLVSLQDDLNNTTQCINDLNNKINSMTLQYEQSEKQYKLTITSLEKELHDANEYKLSIKDEYNTKLNEYTQKYHHDINTLKQQYNNDINNLKQQITHYNTIENDMQHIKDTNVTLLATIEDLRLKHDNCFNEYNILQQQYNTLDDKYNNMIIASQSSETLTSKELGQCQETLNKTQNDLTIAHNEIQQLKIQLSDKDNLIAQMEQTWLNPSDTQSLKDDHSRISLQLKSIQEDLLPIKQAELTTLVENSMELQSQLNTTRLQLDDVQDKYKKSQYDLELLHTQHTHDIDTIRQELDSKYRNEIETLNKQHNSILEECTDDIDNLATQLTSLENEYKMLEDKYKTLEDHYTVAQDRCKNIQDELNTTHNQLKIAQDTLSHDDHNINKQINDLQDIISQHINQHNDDTNTINTINDDNKQLHNNIIKLNDDITQSQNIIIELKQTISNLHDNIEELENNNSILQNNIIKLNDNNVELQNTIIELNDNNTQLHDTITQLTTDNDQLNITITELHTTITELRNTITKLHDDNNNNHNTIDNLQQQISTLSNENEILNANKIQMDTLIDNMNNDHNKYIIETTSYIKQLTSDIEQLNQDITNTKTHNTVTIQQLNDIIEQHNNTIETLHEQINHNNTTKNDTTKHDEIVVELQDKITMLQDKITMLQDKITILQDKITILQQQIDDDNNNNNNEIVLLQTHIDNLNIQLQTANDQLVQSYKQMTQYKEQISSLEASILEYQSITVSSSSTSSALPPPSSSTSSSTSPLSLHHDNNTNTDTTTTTLSDNTNNNELITRITELTNRVESLSNDNTELITDLDTFIEEYQHEKEYFESTLNSYTSRLDTITQCTQKVLSLSYQGSNTNTNNTDNIQSDIPLLRQILSLATNIEIASLPPIPLCNGHIDDESSSSSSPSVLSSSSSSSDTHTTIKQDISDIPQHITAKLAQQEEHITLLITQMETQLDDITSKTRQYESTQLSLHQDILTLKHTLSERDKQLNNANTDIKQYIIQLNDMNDKYHNLESELEIALQTAAESALHAKDIYNTNNDMRDSQITALEEQLSYLNQTIARDEEDKHNLSIRLKSTEDALVESKRIAQDDHTSLSLQISQLQDKLNTQAQSLAEYHTRLEEQLEFIDTQQRALLTLKAENTQLLAAASPPTTVDEIQETNDKTPAVDKDSSIPKPSIDNDTTPTQTPLIDSLAPAEASALFRTMMENLITAGPQNKDAVLENIYTIMQYSQEDRERIGRRMKQEKITSLRDAMREREETLNNVDVLTKGIILLDSAYGWLSTQASQLATTEVDKNTTSQVKAQVPTVSSMPVPSALPDAAPLATISSASPSTDTVSSDATASATGGSALLNAGGSALLNAGGGALLNAGVNTISTLLSSWANYLSQDVDQVVQTSAAQSATQPLEPSMPPPTIRESPLPDHHDATPILQDPSQSSLSSISLNDELPTISLQSDRSPQLTLPHSDISTFYDSPSTNAPPYPNYTDPNPPSSSNTLSMPTTTGLTALPDELSDLDSHELDTSISLPYHSGTITSNNDHNTLYDHHIYNAPDENQLDPYDTLPDITLGLDGEYTIPSHTQSISDKHYYTP